MKQFWKVMTVIFVILGIGMGIFEAVTVWGTMAKVLSLIVYALVGILAAVMAWTWYTVLDNQEIIIARVGKIVSKVDSMGTGDTDDPFATFTQVRPTGQVRPAGKGYWTCPKCRKSNADYVGTCSCGYSKY